MKNKISPTYFILIDVLKNYKNKNKKFSFQDILEKIKKKLSEKGIKSSPTFIGPSYTIQDYLELLKTKGILKEDPIKDIYIFEKQV